MVLPDETVTANSEVIKPWVRLEGGHFIVLLETSQVVGGHTLTFRYPHRVKIENPHMEKANG